MTVIDPIPVEAPYGVADWKDYKHNWREVDTDWIQDRSILRFSTATQRDQKITSPQVGQFIYNNATDALEYRSKTGAWRPYKASPSYLDTVTDTTATVKVAHSSAGSKGLSFTASLLSTDIDVSLAGGVLTAADTGVTIKTGTKIAKLTTDATNLVSDTPITAPSLTLTGAGTVITAAGKTMSIGTLTATSISTGTLTTSGAINGDSGSINGVTFQPNYVVASSGFVCSNGYYHGNTNGAIVRQRTASDGSLGASYLHVLDTYMQSVATYHDFHCTPRVMGERSIQFYNAANDAVLGYAGPVIYTSTALSAANYPNGTIWVTP